MMRRADSRFVLDYATPARRRLPLWLALCFGWLTAPRRIRVILATLTVLESVLWQIKHNPLSYLTSFLAMVSWLVVVVISLAREPHGFAWRSWVWFMLLLCIIGNVGHNKCPHAEYVVVGGEYWTIQGKECGNAGHNWPFARKLWIAMGGPAGEYYGWGPD